MSCELAADRRRRGHHGVRRWHAGVPRRGWGLAVSVGVSMGLVVAEFGARLEIYERIAALGKLQDRARRGLFSTLLRIRTDRAIARECIALGRVYQHHPEA